VFPDKETTKGGPDANATASEKGAALGRSLPVKYEWVELAEHDVESGLVLMFGVSLLLAMAAVAATCARGDSAAPVNARSGYGSGHASERWGNSAEYSDKSR